jgi:DNA-binding GntR family transcriptional regulator
MTTDHTRTTSRSSTRSPKTSPRGRIKLGQRIPSAGTLARTHKVGISTVHTAITLLIYRGILRGHQGVGVFLASVPPEPGQ